MPLDLRSRYGALGPWGRLTVVLWVLNFTTFVEKARVTTAEDGGFVIINRDSHHIQLSAEKPGIGHSARVVADWATDTAAPPKSSTRTAVSVCARSGEGSV